MICVATFYNQEAQQTRYDLLVTNQKTKETFIDAKTAFDRLVKRNLLERLQEDDDNAFNFEFNKRNKDRPCRKL